MNSLPSNQEPTVENVELYIKALYENIRNGYLNMQPKEIIGKKELEIKENDVSYDLYILTADNHYFVARTLFMNFIFEYSLFAGYQCIELYLKAFLKNKGFIPPHRHELSYLLEKCRANASCEDTFIYSNDIYAIIYRFEPYYSIPRYPITNDKSDEIGLAVPHDIFLLDYFVMRIRQILPMPDKENDILTGTGTYSSITKRFAPEFYDKFVNRNINFPNRPISIDSFISE